MIVIDFWKALKAGKEVANPAQWKNSQNLTNALAAIIAFALAAAKLFGMDIPMTDEQIIVFAGGVAAILGVINTVITTATTKKIGIGE